MPILFFYPEKLQPPSKAHCIFDSVKLYPGRNHLSLKEFEKLQKHPSYSKLINNQVIDIFESSETKEILPIDSIVGLNVDDAIKLIRQTLDISLLKQWLEKESTEKARKTVVNAIALQIKDIEAGNL